MKELTRGEHAKRLTHFYANPDKILDWMIGMSLSPGFKDTPAVEALYSYWGDVAKNDPHWYSETKEATKSKRFVEWYNAQFETDFMEKQIERWILLL